MFKKLYILIFPKQMSFLFILHYATFTKAIAQ